jgi:hypothetical protein
MWRAAVAFGCFGLTSFVAGPVESPARTACHPTVTSPVLRANLDGDRAREEVTITNVNCAHEYAYGVNDVCPHYRTHHWLPGTGFHDTRAVVDANGIGDGRELFYVLRRGPHRAPDLGTAALVRLVRVSPDRCPVPRSLFLYRTSEPLLPPPRGVGLSRFDVQLVELSSRYAGPEIRVRETFMRRGIEQQRTMLLRYSRLADHYVIYSPKL